MSPKEIHELTVKILETRTYEMKAIYGTSYMDGYTKGVSVAIEMLRSFKPEVVKVPVFVAEWYEENVVKSRQDVDYALWEHLRSETYLINPTPFNAWIENEDGAIERIVNMQYGYELEERKFVIEQFEGTYMTESEFNKNGDIVCQHSNEIAEAIVFDETTKENAESLIKLVGGRLVEYIKVNV